MMSLHLSLLSGNVLPVELDYMLKDVSGTVQFTANLPSGVFRVGPMGMQ